MLRFLGRSSFYVVSFLGLFRLVGCLEVVQVVRGVRVLWVLSSFGVVGSLVFFGRLDYRLFKVFCFVLLGLRLLRCFVWVGRFVFRSLLKHCLGSWLV